MECAEYKQWIYEYLEDGLSKQDAQAFLAHVEQCEDCKAQLLSARQLMDDLMKLGAVPPAESFAPMLHQTIIAEKKVHKRKRACGLCCRCVRFVGVHCHGCGVYGRAESFYHRQGIERCCALVYGCCKYRAFCV